MGRNGTRDVRLAVSAVLDHSAPADKGAAIRRPVEDLEAKATARAIARLSAGQPVPAGPTTPTG